MSASLQLTPVNLHRCGVTVFEGGVRVIIPEEGKYADGRTVKLSQEQVTRVARAAWRSLRVLPPNTTLEGDQSEYSSDDSTPESDHLLQQRVREAIRQAYTHINSNSHDTDTEITVDDRLATRTLVTKTTEKTYRFDKMHAANKPGPRSELPSRLQDTHKEDLGVDITVRRSQQEEDAFEVNCQVSLCAGARRDLREVDRPYVQQALEESINSDGDWLKDQITHFKNHGEASRDLKAVFRDTALTALRRIKPKVTCSTLRDPSYSKAGTFTVKSKHLRNAPMSADEVSAKARSWRKQYEKDQSDCNPRAHYVPGLAGSIFQNTHLQQCPAGLTLDQWSDTLCDVVSKSINISSFGSTEEVLPSGSLASQIELYRRHELPENELTWFRFKQNPNNFDLVSDVDEATHFGVTCGYQTEEGEFSAFAKEKFIAIRPSEGDKAAQDQANSPVETGPSARLANLSVADPSVHGEEAGGDSASPESEESKVTGSKLKRKALLTAHSAWKRASLGFSRGSTGSR